MLYPLTDNLLDDPRVEGGEKRAFNERFGRRLAGLTVSPGGPREAAVYRLVARIEEEFPRCDFADVFESLLAIHSGQVRSIEQQDEPRLTDSEIVSISCEKGGSSVLADLYLVTGGASFLEERFAFGYGVFLQLLDDLQDVGRDLAAGHPTDRPRGSPVSSTACSTRTSASRDPSSPSARTSSAATVGRSWSAPWPTSRGASPTASAAASPASGRSLSAPCGACVTARSSVIAEPRARSSGARARRRCSTWPWPT
jgi:hypothetical protein